MKQGKSRWLIQGETIAPLAYFHERSARNMLVSLQDCGHVCEMEHQRLVNGQWVRATHDLSLLYTADVGGEG